MGGSKKTTTTNETAVTQPNTPPYALGPIQNYYGQVGNFAQTDPYSLVAPPNALQTQAAGTAANFQPSSLFGTAANAINYTGAAPQAQAPNAPALAQTSLAGLPPALQAASTGYNPTMLGTAAQAASQGYSPSLLGDAAQATAQGYTAPSLGQAGQAGLTTANAAQAGPAATYNAATANATGFNSPVHTANAESLLTGLQNYVNPYTNSVVDTTLAGFDNNAGQVRAAQAADMARNGAFSGSRSAILQAQTEADLQRERAATEAGLRDTAYNNALGASQYDTTNRQNTGFFNANAENSRDELQAQLAQQLGISNAGFLNNAGQFNAGSQNQVNLANAGFRQDANLANANAANQMGQFNTGQGNQFALSQADLNAAASQFGASANNQANLFNAGAQNQYGLANQGAQNEASQFSAGAANQANLFNAGAQNQFGIANQGAANEAAQFGAGAQNAASMFNTGQGNQFLSQLQQAAQGVNNQNATAANSLNSLVYGTNAGLNQFNAGQQQQQQQINNAGATSLANIGSAQGQQELAQTALQGDLGGQLQQLQQAYQSAPAAFLAAYGQMLDPSVLQAITGQTITSNGTTVQRSSGGLLGTLAGIASIGAGISDRRAKHNVVKLGELPDGLGVYAFDYIWPAPRQLGVMADEVAALRPWALGPEIGGYMSVNYARL